MARLEGSVQGVVVQMRSDVERDQNFIIHEDLLKTLYKDPKGKDKGKWKKVGSFLGKDMKGWRYEPLFDYFVESVSPVFAGLLCPVPPDEI